MPTIPRNNSIINLNIPANAPDGFTDPQVKAAVELFLNGFNNMLQSFEDFVAPTQKDMSLWSSLKPSDTLLRAFAGRLYVTAGEALNAGDFVNLYLDAGILKARKANAAAGNNRPAKGYCSTSGGILLGEIGEVILTQGLLGVTGVVIGTEYYLSAAVPGVITATPPTAAGQLEQFIGTGVDTNLLYVDIASGRYINH